MSSDKELKVEVGATTDKLSAGMQQAAATVKSGVSEIKHSFAGIGDAIDAAMGPLKLFAAVLAGGAVFKSAIADTVAFTGEVVTLSKKMGMTTEAATTLNIGLKLIGATSDDYVNAAMKMDRQLKKNEAGLQSMGMATRDSNGRLLDQQTLMQNGLKVLMQYEAGTDRNMAATDLFGRSFDEVSKLMKLNNGVMAEAARLQKAYNIEVTGEGIQAVKDYKMSLAAMKIALGAIEDAIGKAVLPIINRLGAWFRGEGPGVIGVFIQVLEHLGATFGIVADMATDMVKTVVDVFNFMGKVTTDTIGGMPKEFNMFQIAMQTITVVMLELRFTAAAVFGDVAVVAKIAMSEVKRLGDTWSAFQNIFQGKQSIGDAWAAGAKRGADIVAEQEARIQKLDRETKEAIAKTLGGGHDKAAEADAKPAPGGHKAYKAFDDTSGKKDKDERMKQWEADLLRQKTNYMLENEMREMSLADETAYWRKIVASLKDGDHAKSSAKKKQAEAEFAEAKFTAKQMTDLQAEVAQFKEKMDLGALDKERSVTEQKLALGLITQEQFILAEQEYENRRYAIAASAMRERLALLDKDPTANLVERQKLLDQMLLMEQKHANDVLKIQQKQVLEAKKPYMEFNQSVQNSFKTAISGMLQGTLTFSSAMKGLFKGIIGAFADMVAGMVVKWLAAMIMNRVAQATTGIAQVMSNAAVAGSAAFASIAAIPIIGPAMAPGAAIAAYAGAAAFAPLASARDGYDIPAGLNPVTQLHEREMVLPQAQADAVRDMANGGGGGGMTVNISAVDARSVERLFKDNGRHIATALQGQLRNFAVKGAK